MRVLVLVVKVVLAGILIGQVGFGSQVGVMDIKGKEDLHYAYKVRNIGRVRPRLRFCVLC